MKNIKKFDEFINEGIDFDKKSMTVWFTPTEEKYVDTSLENNPTIDKEIMTDVEVWSIFRRAKDGNKDDGNPLIYALKGERVAPVSRKITARIRVTKAAAPATSAKIAP